MLPRTVAYLLLRFGPGLAPIHCREEGGSKQDLKEQFFRKTTLTIAKPVKEQNHWARFSENGIYLHQKNWGKTCIQ